MKVSSIISLASTVALLVLPEGVQAKSKGSGSGSSGSALRVSTTPSQQGLVDYWNGMNNVGDLEGDSGSTGTVGGGQAMEANVPTYSGEPRILDVVVSYGANPQDVDWNLYNMANPGLAVLWSSFGEVGEPGVVVKRAPNLRPGRYRLIMSNLKGQGISSGTGWVKIVNATGTELWETNTSVPTLDEEGLVFLHNGRFGPRLDSEFDLF